jgi:hypothetical protein
MSSATYAKLHMPANKASVVWTIPHTRLLAVIIVAPPQVEVCREL